MRLLENVNGTQGVSTGGTATLQMPLQRRYHCVTLFPTLAGAATDVEAFFTRIQLIVNGVVIRDETPSSIIKLAKMNGKALGYTPATGELPLFFSEADKRSITGEEATSWDVFGQNSFVIKMFIASGLVGTPAIDVEASFDFDRNQTVNTQTGAVTPFLAIVKRNEITFNVPDGYYNITTLPTDKPISKVLLSGSAGVSDVFVKADGTIVNELTLDQNNRFLAQNGLDGAGSGWSFPIVFDYDRQASSFLNVNNYLNIRVNSGGAQTLTVLLEQKASGYV